MPSAPTRASRESLRTFMPTSPESRNPTPGVPLRKRLARIPSPGAGHARSRSLGEESLETRPEGVEFPRNLGEIAHDEARAGFAERGLGRRRQDADAAHARGARGEDAVDRILEGEARGGLEPELAGGGEVDVRRRLAAGRVLGADDLREARREPEPLEDERAVPGRRGGGDGERHAGALQIVHELEQPWEWLEARAVERAVGALLLLGEDVERLARELVPEQRRQDLVVLLARELVLEDRRL